MFTALYLFTVAPLIVLLLALFTAVRIGRVNFIEGLLVFFFFVPLGALWALIAHWRDPDVRVRLPALLALVVAGAWIGAISIGARAGRQEVAAATARRASESTLARDLRLSTAVANLPMRDGTVYLPAAQARIEVPAHFRFVERGALAALFRQFDDELDRETVGWLVHESVDLAADDAWFVVVDWHRDGFVAEGDFAALPPDKLLADAQRATLALAEQDDENFRLLRYADDPLFDAAQHVVTWVEETTDGETPGPVVDCYAAKLGRRGVFEFSLTDMAPRRRELCLRSVRLAAARTTFADGEAYADHSRLFDRKARYDLAGLVTGTALLKP